MPEITCFVQTSMVGMPYGEVVTLEHTPYIDALIAGGRLVAQSDPIFGALIDINREQPPSFDLLDTAASAASPESPVTPASVALNDLPLEPPVPDAAPVDTTPVADVAPVVDVAPVPAVVTEAPPVDAVIA